MAIKGRAKETPFVDAANFVSMGPWQVWFLGRGLVPQPNREERNLWNHLRDNGREVPGIGRTTKFPAKLAMKIYGIDQRNLNPSLPSTAGKEPPGFI